MVLVGEALLASTMGQRQPMLLADVAGELEPEYSSTIFDLGTGLATSFSTEPQQVREPTHRSPPQEHEQLRWSRFGEIEVASFAKTCVDMRTFR